MENYTFPALASSVLPVSGRKELKRTLSADDDNDNAKKSKTFEAVRKLKSKKLQGLPLEVAEALRVKTNEQERERQKIMNAAFDNLRLLRMPYNPNLPGHKEDSKYYLLKTASAYIYAMMDMIRDHDSGKLNAHCTFTDPGLSMGHANQTSPLEGFGSVGPFPSQPQHPGLPTPRFPLNDATNFQQAYCMQPLPGHGQFASPNNVFQNQGQLQGHLQPTTPVAGNSWSPVGLLRPPGDLSCKRLAPSKTPHPPQRASTSHPFVSTPTRPSTPMSGRSLHHYSPIFPPCSPMAGHEFRNPLPAPSQLQYSSTPLSGHGFVGPFEPTNIKDDPSLQQGECYLEQFMPSSAHVSSELNTPNTSSFQGNQPTPYQDNAFDSGHFSASNISNSNSFHWSDVHNAPNGHFNLQPITTAPTAYPCYQQNNNSDNDNFLFQNSDTSGQDSGHFSFDWLTYTDEGDNQKTNTNTSSLSYPLPH